jgi:DNA-binding MarR family transcriptional regulator
LLSRLRRLTDRLARDGRRVYAELDIEFEPVWFPVFYLLSRNSPISVTDLARELRITHPAVNQVTTAMAKAGLVTSHRDKQDDRRRMVSLSAKGRRLAKELLPVWSAFETATSELFQGIGVDLIDALDRIETALDETDQFTRIMAVVRRRQHDSKQRKPFKPKVQL